MRVMVADDVALFRDGVAGLLRGAGVTVTATVGDAESLLTAVRADPPDAVIVDIRMPPTHTTEGLAVAVRIRGEHPGVAVLVLSHHVETHHTIELLGDDPQRVGYLLKDRVATLDELVEALHRLVDGGAVVDPTVVARLVSRALVGDPLSRLSPREREVLGLLAEGRSNHAIGVRLRVRPKTVEGHVRSIFTKLGIPDDRDGHRRVRAVLHYLSR